METAEKERKISSRSLKTYIASRDQGSFELCGKIPKELKALSKEERLAISGALRQGRFPIRTPVDLSLILRGLEEKGWQRIELAEMIEKVYKR